MRIKIKDEMDKIKITFTHRELVLLKEYLLNPDKSLTNTNEINDMLFDRDEITAVWEPRETVYEMGVKIADKLDKINVY